MIDRAYWISWYNLPEEGREQHLGWLHRQYIPKVLERAGVLWAAHYASEENVVPLGGGKGRVGHTKLESVPAGDRFILIFGAEEPRFVNGVLDKLAAQLRPAEMRRG